MTIERQTDNVLPTREVSPHARMWRTLLFGLARSITPLPFPDNSSARKKHRVSRIGAHVG
jgi:hypothetical protein